MMNSEAILVHGVHPTGEDVCLRRLIEFLGLTCRTVDTSLVDVELDRAANHDLCILASAATIHSWCHDLPDPTAALHKLLQKASFLFVYGFAPETPTYIATSLSDRALADVRPFTAAGLRYEVSSLQPDITREFSGLSFGGVRSATDFGFVCSVNTRNMAPLVTIDGMPFWALVENNHCKAFLLACSSIADIQEEVNGNIDATKYFSRLLPAAMFLRSVFKNLCWHNPRRFANFIIDDPPLKRSYGYLNYRDLISTIDKAGFATTIAFIPWNHRRTDEEVVQLFRERPDRLSLCVHGCDHTTAEFSTADLAVVNSRVQLASARMNTLQRQDGLLYSKAMVFPQGRFSIEALIALKSNNYLAAVNSSASPEGSAANPSLTVEDFLEPAVTRYSGFPLFVRRYPAGLEQFAFDLFFGKPALVVEHHGYFKDGVGRLVGFIAGLNSLARLQWADLSDILSRSYVEREVSHNIVACKLYTNDHVIENRADRERMFMVFKHEAGDVPVQNVLVNGQVADFVAVGKMLKFATRIPGFSSTAVKIAYRNVLPGLKPGHTVSSPSRVWPRRLLAEFRDNVLSRNDFLLGSFQVLHRKLSRRRDAGTEKAGGQPAAPPATAQWRSDLPSNKCRSAAELAREVLGSNSRATISNVLVLGSNGSTPPVKRTEIHLGDLNDVPATLNLLAAALQRSGIDFQAVENPGMPMTEIWLTSPLHDGKVTLLSSSGGAGAHRVRSGPAFLETRPNNQPKSRYSSRQP